MNHKIKKEKPFEYQIGSRYIVGGKKYLVTEKEYNKTLGYLINDEGDPYGKKRILGLPMNRKVEMI